MPHAVGAFDPPVACGHRHVQSLLAGWPWRQRWLRRRAAGLLAASRDEIVDCGAGVRLLGHFSPQPGDGAGPRDSCCTAGRAAPRRATSSRVGGLLYDAGFAVFRLNFRDHGDDLRAEPRAVPFVPDRRGRRRVGRNHGAASGRPHVRRRPFARRQFRAARGGASARRRVSRSRRSSRVCPVLRPVEHDARARGRACGCIGTISCAAGGAACSPKAACFPELYDFGDLRRFPTLTATTEFFATRYASFPDLDAYLNGYAITGDALARLTVPAHLIAAADDPVIPIDDLARSRGHAGANDRRLRRTAGIARSSKTIACAAGSIEPCSRSSTLRRDAALGLPLFLEGRRRLAARHLDLALDDRRPRRRRSSCPTSCP